MLSLIRDWFFRPWVRTHTHEELHWRLMEVEFSFQNTLTQKSDNPHKEDARHAALTLRSKGLFAISVRDSFKPNV